MTSRFSALPFFAYPVSDIDRACAFYQDVLGLIEVARWEKFWVEFAIAADAPGPVLALATDMDGCDPGAKGGAVALETADFEGMVAHLKAHQVTFVMEPEETSVCYFARFLDPDGNHLILHRIHDAPAGVDA
jgi:catechol 2,3-dioxygenase-like lactoylglutathione lyase family enzyme